MSNTLPGTGNVGDSAAGVTRLKLEYTEADASTATHPTHTELWVRVLSDDLLGPGDWNLKVKPFADSEQLKPYALTPCGFHADLWDDSDPDWGAFAYEHYWIFPRHGE